MAILSKEALKRVRTNKGLKQEALAEIADLTSSTISRMERGRILQVREKTLKKLAAALDVRPEEICDAPASKPDDVKFTMDTGARNALNLVVKRYGVSRTYIVELAPLLFYIIAERSLAVRRKRLEDIREAASSLENLQLGAPHLPSLAPVDVEALQVEAESIEARDLFAQRFATGGHSFSGLRSESYDEEKENPLATYLSKALRETLGQKDTDDDLFFPPPSRGSPNYLICYDEAAEIVGGDEQAAWAILTGRAALHKMPKGTPEQRAKWALEQARGPVLEDSEVSEELF